MGGSVNGNVAAKDTKGTRDTKQSWSHWRPLRGRRRARASGGDEGDRPGSLTSAANGNVTRIRKSIRNSESPKLYSNIPADSMAATAASAAAAGNRRPPARNRFPSSIVSEAMNQIQAAS